MALAFSMVDTWDDGKRIHVSGTIAATGNYVTSGDTLDLSRGSHYCIVAAADSGHCLDGWAGRIRLRFHSWRGDECE